MFYLILIMKGGILDKINLKDVKNVDNTFTKVARHERVRFVGNVGVGTDVKVSELRQVNDLQPGFFLLPL